MRYLGARRYWWEHMKLKTLLGGAALAVLVSSGAQAGSHWLPGVFGPESKPPVVRVQADIALQEEIRRLNGRIEELNFQILQMQDQMRKMQEDNEFRFQELEGGKAPAKKTDAAPAPSSNDVADAGVQPPATVTADASHQDQKGVLVASADPSASVIAPGDPSLAPRSMGTITFDENGNVIGGAVGDQAVIEPDPNGAVQQPGADNTVVASLPRSDDPETAYRDAYDLMLQGQYATAEAAFADHITRFPQDARTADARFWLGEAQLGQRKYREAAETFLATSKAYPKAKKAPDTLLKLGVSLVGLNQTEVACATFAEVGKRYPNAGAKLRERVTKEQAAAGC